MSCVQHGCHSRDNRMFIHRCDIQRANVSIATSPITDRKIRWDVVHATVRCWFDSGGGRMVRNKMLGQVPVGRFSVWFPGGTDVMGADRLTRVVKGVTKYYEVESVEDHGDEGGLCLAIVNEKTYAMGQ